MAAACDGRLDTNSCSRHCSHHRADATNDVNTSHTRSTVSNRFPLSLIPLQLQAVSGSWQIIGSSGSLQERLVATWHACNLQFATARVTPDILVLTALANHRCTKSLSHGVTVLCSCPETEATGKLPEGRGHLQPKEMQTVAARQQAWDCSPGHHNQSHLCSPFETSCKRYSEPILVTNCSCSPQQALQNCASTPYLFILHSCLPAAQRNELSNPQLLPHMQHAHPMSHSHPNRVVLESIKTQAASWNAAKGKAQS